MGTLRSCCPGLRRCYHRHSQARSSQCPLPGYVCHFWKRGGMCIHSRHLLAALLPYLFPGQKSTKNTFLSRDCILQRGSCYLRGGRNLIGGWKTGSRLLCLLGLFCCFRWNSCSKESTFENGQAQK